MLCRVTTLSMMVVKELGNGDLPTRHNERAAFDLHGDTSLMLLTWKTKKWSIICCSIGTASDTGEFANMPRHKLIDNDALRYACVYTFKD